MEKTSEPPASTPPLRYKKPRILTIDLPVSLAQRLRGAGYNVLPGTFGRPYKVKKGDDFVPIIAKASVPHYAEQDIVAIDLTPPSLADRPQGEKHTSFGELDWFAKASWGEIDPRPRVMDWLRDDSNRILRSGGAFILFAEPRLHQKMVLASFENDYFREFQVRREIEEDNWSILSVLDQSHLRVEAEFGTDIKVTRGLGQFSSFLHRHVPDATFSATLHPLSRLSEHGDGPVFVPLATNKFGDTVACVLFPRKSGEGLVLILPHFVDKEKAVADLIEAVLPEMLPRLFPDHEGGRWVHRVEYEHGAVLERKAAQLEVQRKANEEVARLEREIDAERGRMGFLHGLLTKSGIALVDDVKQSLEFVGFTRLANVDECEGSEVNKQEDLQVLDKSPTILLEVKGLAGLPTEGDTLQVTKYVLRRIRQWQRADVIGLSLVNHQRNLPALERDHANAFTEQQVQDAMQNGTGLMTTWDLFRLIRGMTQWGWPSAAVKDVFYGHGRLSQIPSHYRPVGTVVHYWTANGAVSIDLSGDTLRIGDRVGYIFADGFIEEEVTSLQFEKKAVSEAHPSQRVGMKTTLNRDEIPVGTRVFRVASFT